MFFFFYTKKVRNQIEILLLSFKIHNQNILIKTRLIPIFCFFFADQSLKNLCAFSEDIQGIEHPIILHDHTHVIHSSLHCTHRLHNHKVGHES